jgi:hypothetical protein
MFGVLAVIGAVVVGVVLFFCAWACCVASSRSERRARNLWYRMENDEVK